MRGSRPAALDRLPPVGEHARAGVEAVEPAAGVGAGEADGDIRRAAAQVQHMARHIRLVEPGLEARHEHVVGLLEVGPGVGPGLLFAVHQFRFGGALHLDPW